MWKNTRLVPGADGVWAAGVGQPVDSGRSSGSRDGREGEQCGQVSRVVAALCSFDEKRSGGRFRGKRDGLTVHDTDGAGTHGQTKCYSRSDARRWKRAAANRRERSESALLAVD